MPATPAISTWPEAAHRNTVRHWPSLAMCWECRAGEGGAGRMEDHRVALALLGADNSRLLTHFSLHPLPKSLACGWARLSQCHTVFLHATWGYVSAAGAAGMAPG